MLTTGELNFDICILDITQTASLQDEPMFHEVKQWITVLEAGFGRCKSMRINLPHNANLKDWAYFWETMMSYSFISLMNEFVIPLLKWKE